MLNILQLKIRCSIAIGREQSINRSLIDTNIVNQDNRPVHSPGSGDESSIAGKSLSNTNVLV